MELMSRGENLSPFGPMGGDKHTLKVFSKKSRMINRNTEVQDKRNDLMLDHGYWNQSNI